MKVTRNGIFQTFAFMLATLAATAALVGAGLAGPEVNPDVPTASLPSRP